MSAICLKKETGFALLYEQTCQFKNTCSRKRGKFRGCVCRDVFFVDCYSYPRSIVTDHVRNSATCFRCFLSNTLFKHQHLKSCVFVSFCPCEISDDLDEFALGRNSASKSVIVFLEFLNLSDSNRFETIQSDR